MGLCYINEFRPLAKTQHGRTAIEQHMLPPFIDASCRREPDFESKYPSITALCRKGYFAPRLQLGDVVAYMTANFSFPPESGRTRRLVAVLRVQKSWQAHAHAAEWYREQHLDLPSNCMVSENNPMPLDMTDRYQPNLILWDRHYRHTADQFGVFHACEKVCCELHDPPRLTNEQLVHWFSTIPDTRELPPFPPQDFAKMVRWLAGQTADAASRLRLEALAQSLLQCAFHGEL
jgi:hypothetical protein